MSKRSDEYSAQSIQVLKGLEAVKKRPGMYIGDTSDGSGLHHMIYEVIDNSIDEALAGYCNKIIVTLNNDGSVSVSDNGRGIPVDIHKQEGISAAELIMTRLHAGGKFDDNSYKISGGLHGVGISVVNALSEWLSLTIWRNNNQYQMSFNDGVKNQDLHINEKGLPDKTGTEVKFFPSRKIFSSISFDFEIIKTRLQEISFLNSTVSIEFKDCRTQPHQMVNFRSDDGIMSFVKFLSKSNDSLHDIIHITGEDKGIFLDIAFQWSDHSSETSTAFTNNIKQKDGGSHLTGFRGALTRVINNYLDKNPISKRQQVKPVSEDMREGLTSVISVRVPDPKFSSQTKDKLISGEVRSIVESIVYDRLLRWLEINPKDARTISLKITQNAIAREAARKARSLSKQQNNANSMVLPGKLANCQEKDPNKCEIFLVEGDSAGGSAKQARDRKTQAILPLKGKILNVEKARFDKILNFEEISTIITALKITLNKQEFDLTNLRYRKVVIMTDADVDGLHIQTLLLTFFFRHLPQLIEQGCLYIAQPPLYKIKCRNNDVFLKSDIQLDQYLKTMILKDIKILLDGKQIDTKYTQTILEKLNILQDIIQEEKKEIPDYIVEILILEGYFGNIWNTKSIKQALCRYSGDSEIRWEIDEILDGIVITKHYYGVEETYKVSNSFLCIHNQEKLKKVIETLKTFLYNGKVYFKENIIHFRMVSELYADLLTLTKEEVYIQRFKGLGEMNPDQLWDTTLNPKTRTLLQVYVTDAKKANEVFSTLMGDIVEPRKRFIQRNASKAGNIDF